MLSRRHLVTGLLCACASPSYAIEFDQLWQEQSFPGRKPDLFNLQRDAVDVTSEQGVSLLYRTTSQKDWGARKAAWQWSVSKSVIATDLTKKGGDDRNLAIYFIFFPPSSAESMSGATISRALRDRTARILIYVWGGDQPRESVLASPYLGDRSATIVLRPSGVGRFSETVDLASDYTRAFGVPAEALFAIAISADSDDTGGEIAARIENLVLG